MELHDLKKKVKSLPELLSQEMDKTAKLTDQFGSKKMSNMEGTVYSQLLFVACVDVSFLRLLKVLRFFFCVSRHAQQVFVGNLIFPLPFSPPFTCPSHNFLCLKKRSCLNFHIQAFNISFSRQKWRWLSLDNDTSKKSLAE